MASTTNDEALLWGRNFVDIELERRMGVQNEQRRHRKRDRAQMENAATNIAPPNDVIELLDDDDDDDDNNNNNNNKEPSATGLNNVIDLSTSIPADVFIRVPSPVKDGEVEILDDPQRKPPPVASIPGATADAAPPPSNPPSHVLRVLEIFPDADVEYVKKKLREQDNNIQVVVAVLSENTNYPKQKKDSAKPSAINNSTVIKGSTDKWKDPKHNYENPNAEFELTPLYKTEVIDLLLSEFCFLKRNGLIAILRNHKNRYTLARNHIHDLILGRSPNDKPPAAAAPGSKAAQEQEEKETRDCNELRKVLVRGRVSAELRQRLPTSYCLKKPRPKMGRSIVSPKDETLLDEHIQFVRKYRAWQETIKKRLRSKEANQQALKDGTAVQCSCCFDDVARSECVPCKEKGHLFCKDCIVQYVESQVFGSGNLGIDKKTKKPNLELKCCEGSGCNSGFREELLKNALPPKTWEKYSEMQAKAQIEQAGLGGNLAMCPKCGYQAEVPETQNIFECPVEGCHFVSCRKCGKKSHIPLRCEEVSEQTRRDQGRLKIEEALSEAKMRTCPKCKKKFIKSDGCNKMTCACGTKMCYICRQPLNHLKGNVYSHFCQVPHCDHKSCGKCKLYTQNEEDDVQAMRDAGIAAKEAYEQKIQNEGGDGIENLKLSVDEIMADPLNPQQRKATKRQPPRRARNARPQRQPRAPQQQDPRPEFMQQQRRQMQQPRRARNGQPQGQPQAPQQPDPRPEFMQMQQQQRQNNQQGGPFNFFWG